ncbi:MAG: hypothetical protein LWX10_02955 [Spirochaetia bacterium]|nr:hypothetical protein [Spirochaetia bacterium]
MSKQNCSSMTTKLLNSFTEAKKLSILRTPLSSLVSLMDKMTETEIYILNTAITEAIREKTPTEATYLDGGGELTLYCSETQALQSIEHIKKIAKDSDVSNLLDSLLQALKDSQSYSKYIETPKWKHFMLSTLTDMEKF